ncbi:hypothetical protein [Actinotalea sp.]|uniref:hypothetical protein n=1 Tax=Actinotalea sp. TaxID=1872145 RepID=UPI00356993D8
MRKGMIFAVSISLLTLIYVVAISGRAIGLIATGQPVAILLGLGVLLVPVLGAALLAREWWMAVQVQRMADELASRGALPVDDLPRSPGGRVDRGAADAAFATAQQDVEASPQDWAAWFRLGFAYDAARDRSRARAALRNAVRLRRQGAAA